MSDRKKLQEELNRVNELYQQKDLELRKAGGSIDQRQKMRDLLNAKKQSLMAELGDDLTTLNRGKSIAISGGRKMLGALPLVGAGMAALSGDPAMAAEELAQDAAGPLGEVVRSDSAGMSPEDEKMMLQEDRARKSYQKSPARLARLKRILQGDE